ncbi:ABC transporter [Fictibacillus macauensis ZFHKF-1]|uniref:ABC transporter n=1 Tax=Fictibacillus macauensis ZFHKF-1 TaxID=1196324 RepID=I8AFU4_9BACL|nr:ABC transporter ATP-binding protein [Fictibacillus macauensis]EIT84477.1 ABC transporter [Fictibacillus macauensis ZFHKF-1]
MSELLIDTITKSYKKYKALDQITLQISPGMFGLLGPNGAGKTTLMRILTTIVEPTAGTITFGDVTWKQPEAVRQLIGYLPQKFSLYKHITVTEVLTHIATMKGMTRRKEQAVADVLEKVNLQDHRHKKIKELSGGMVRRVGIAQAILHSPKIIVVDEPTAGLDPQERIRFRKLLRQLGKEATVIVSTHIVEDIESICDTLAVLKKGHVIFNGSLQTLTEMAANDVWEMEASKEAFFDAIDELDIISSKYENHRYRYRVVSTNPLPGAKHVTPNLEEAYMYLMGQAQR